MITVTSRIINKTTTRSFRKYISETTVKVKVLDFGEGCLLNSTWLKRRY